MKIAFFDTKSYDRESFNYFAEKNNIKIKYFETKLNEDTVGLASGSDAVCVFVNDTVNAAVIDKLTSAEYGVVSSMSEIDAVGHRVVHGGEAFAASTLITAVPAFLMLSSPVLASTSTTSSPLFML